MRILLSALAVSTLFSQVAQAAANEAIRSLVVVELFTSQGCSSCPPADKVLSELAQQAGVLALSLPVDYWDNLGWADTFAKPEFTARQRAYAAWMKSPQVYTPQAVINGVDDVVGSRRQAMIDAVTRRAQSAAGVSTSLTADQQGLALAIGPSDRSAFKGANIVQIHYRHHGHAVVKRGENGGRELDYRNVVIEMKIIGTYQGQAIRQILDKNVPEAGTGIAILIQQPGLGPILGAAAFDS